LGKTRVFSFVPWSASIPSFPLNIFILLPRPCMGTS
jgi:hypothetical protein